MVQITPKSTSTAPVWGERTVSALLAVPCFVTMWGFLMAIPIIGYIFAIIEIFVIRVWNWIHTLPLPCWLESILIFLDHVIEKIVVIVSDIIRWIVGPRDRKSKEKPQINKR